MLTIRVISEHLSKFIIDVIIFYTHFDSFTLREPIFDRLEPAKLVLRQKKIVRTVVNYLIRSQTGENHSKQRYHGHRHGVCSCLLFDQIVRIHVKIRIADAKYKIFKT